MDCILVLRAHVHVYAFTCGPGSVLDTGDTMSYLEVFSLGFIFKMLVLDQTLTIACELFFE